MDSYKKTLIFALVDRLKTLGFEGFIHTTELVNFLKIARTGYLIPRTTLEQKNIKFDDKANRNVIQKSRESSHFPLECCRFYYFYKTPTNYRANYKKPVIIVLDEKILYDLNYESDYYFTNGNASSKYTVKTQNVTDALSFDWEMIAQRGPYDSNDFYITRCRNAEFLINKKVSLNFIKAIYFKNREDMIYASYIIRDDDIKEKFKVRKEVFN